MAESSFEKYLGRVANGLTDQQAGQLTGRVGEAIRSHWKRYKLTKAGPRYLNVDTGNLRSSVTVVPHSNGRDSIVGTNVVYAPVHEYGSSDGRNRARHHLRDSINDSEADQKRAVDAYMRRLLSG